MAKHKLVPIHHQIYLTLRNELVSGHFRADQPMPDEPTLAARFGASRMTLRRALARLQHEKLIVRTPRRGTFPRPPVDPYPIPNSIEEFHKALIARDDIARQVVRSARMVATPEFLRGKGNDFGSNCLRVAKVTYSKAGPMHFGVHFVPGALAQRLQAQPPSRRGDLIWLQDLGIKPTRTDMLISAAAADIEAARALRVDVGAPLISTRRYSYDADDQPIEYLEALSRTDRYNYMFRFAGSSSRGSLLQRIE